MVQLPGLYHTTKTGTVQQWSVRTEGPDVITTYGQKGGAMQEARYTAEPKNVGRANATTPEQQALLEAESLWKAKKRKKYSETIEEAKAPPPQPMLAHDYFKRQDKEVAAALEAGHRLHVQPKLDGARCLAYLDDAGNVVLMSRGNKHWENVPHIALALKQHLRPGMVLDGELYSHGLSFQEITRRIKKYRPGLTEAIQYHIYDAYYPAEPSLRFEDRHNALWAWWSPDMPACLRLVRAATVFTLDDVFNAHEHWLSHGYEGSMVRLPGAPYEPGYRSTGLLKLKNFQDAEYRIVGYTTGKGKMAECVIWECETESGQRFKVTPEGTMEERKAMLEEAEEAIGQYLTVRFFELTDDGIPRFPIGAGVRLPEDMAA